MSEAPEYKGTISYDLPNSPDRVATSLIFHGRYVCELFPGDQWTVFGGLIVIVNPTRRPRVVWLDTREEQELVFASAVKDKT
jgi:hypothetical protein